MSNPVSDDREQVTLYPLTLLILLLGSMVVGVVVTWLGFAVSGSRSADCAGFWQMEEETRLTDGPRIGTGMEGNLE